MEMEGDPAKPRGGRRKTCLCLCATAAFLIAILLLCLILGLTVLKPKRPVTTVNSVSLSDLDVSLSSLTLNVTLAVDLSIRNPNKVGFKYDNSTALLDYRGQDVGEAPIPAGQISAGETLPLNLTLVVMADRFVSNSHAFGDVVSGTLPLSARTAVSGRVSILGFIHIHVVSHTTCNFTVSLTSRNISDNACTYKTKL